MQILALAPGLSLSSRRPSCSGPRPNSSSAGDETRLAVEAGGRTRKRLSSTVILTSELWGEQQGLEQRVKVAGASLVFDAAQIASPTRRGWLARAL